MSDDRLGRALDRLFEADRAALLIEVVLAVAKRFAVQLQRLHNGSSSNSFCGQYRDGGVSKSGRRAPAITYGYSKDHRPDLKQLLFILTTDADGGVPVQFRTADGNTIDSITHIETWTTLRAVAGRADFLYVADSKLCSHDNLTFIDRAGGRFVTVLARSRWEDEHFRKLLQTEPPNWELVWDRPNARRRDGARDVWSVYGDPLGSTEGVSLIWVWSTLLTLRQQARHHRIIATPPRRSPRCAGVRRYLKVKRVPRPEHTFKQKQRGRPGPDTEYRCVTHRRYDIEWSVDQAAIDYDKKSDGMYPLICNDRALTPAQILEAHKGQPTTEQILRLFSLAERHTLLRDHKSVQSFPPQLTDMQIQTLDLLGVPAKALVG